MPVVLQGSGSVSFPSLGFWFSRSLLLWFLVLEVYSSAGSCRNCDVVWLRRHRSWSESGSKGRNIQNHIRTSWVFSRVCSHACLQIHAQSPSTVCSGLQKHKRIRLAKSDRGNTLILETMISSSGTGPIGGLEVSP